jgi:hypothetical protein
MRPISCTATAAPTIRGWSPIGAFTASDRKGELGLRRVPRIRRRPTHPSVMQFDSGPPVHFLFGVDMADEPPLEIVVALHVGTVTYANIGATDRIDFAVIGPAVNLVSRIEGVAKALDRPILFSSDFARALGDGMVSPGLHDLRGLATPQELFAPA